MSYLDKEGLAYLWQKFKMALTQKQNTLTGQPGQVAGFDASGDAAPVWGLSNPNLLDNWYFVDPINQRGQTEYQGNEIYTFDRYKISSNPVIVKIMDGFIRMEKVVEAANNPTLYQIIECPSEFAGRTATLSVLYRTGGNAKCMFGIVIDGTEYKNEDFLPGSDTWALAAFSITIPSDSTQISVRVMQVRSQTEVDSYVDIMAAKLELGPVQTLAHQDADGDWVLNDLPLDKGIELAKCQRYMINLIKPVDPNYCILGIGQAQTSGSAYIFIPLPVEMRDSKPTITYSGNIRLVKNTGAVNGIIPASITLDHINRNGISVKATGSFAPGDIFFLWAATPASGETNLFIIDNNF